MANAIRGKAGIWSKLGLYVWIVVTILALADKWLMAGLAGTILGAIIVAAEYRRRAVMLMDCTSLVYFVAIAIICLGGSAHFIRHYHVVLVWTIFAAVAWASDLRGNPFTIQYAREQAPPAIWDDPVFIRMNHRLTQVWSIVFSACAILGGVSIFAGHQLLLGVMVPVAAMTFGFEFSKRYPRRFSDRWMPLENPEATAEAIRIT